MSAEGEDEQAALPVDRLDENGADAEAMGLIELLADEVGSRRPTSRSEALAALLLRDHLRRRGLGAELQGFDGYSTFTWPFALIQAAAILPGLLPSRRRTARSAIAMLAGAALAAEGSLYWTPVSDALAQRRSANVVATLEPAGPGPPARTLCLMAHMDSSRSGLMFDPRFVGLLGHWISAQSVATLAQAAGEPFLGGSRRGRRALRAARSVLALGLVVLAERELRGVDVPGANDNASGVAVVSVLAAELAAAPLEDTRVTVLLTGCEESGTLGSQAFLDANETADWFFLNFDNVGGPGSVRYLRREGVLAKWDADPGLIRAAELAAESHPELRLKPTNHPAGLTYDTSPVLARGGRGMTISVQDGSIPNLHWPTDTVENVDRDGVGRTLRAGRELVRLIDAGAADPR